MVRVVAQNPRLVGQIVDLDTPGAQRGEHCHLVVERLNQEFEVPLEVLHQAKALGFVERDTPVGKDIIDQPSPADPDFPSSLQKPFPTRPVVATPEKLEDEAQSTPEANQGLAAGALGTVGPVNEDK